MIKVSKGNIRAWSRLGQRGSFFAIAMPEIAKEKDNLKVLTADLSILSNMKKIKENYPDKFLQVGIAEQNMIGIAAGLAMEGDCVFASTYASFIAVRSLEHVRQHLSHLQCNIKIVGTAAGVVAARSGVSHWATEDLAFTRALPDIEVFSAADSLEAVKIAQYAASVDKPMYIRLSGGADTPIVYQEDYEFIPGKMVEVRTSKNKEKNTTEKKVVVLATGLMVNESLKVAQILEERGLDITVINVHTIKPLDTEKLDGLFSIYDLIVTIEEHNVIGGLGSAVAEYKATRENTPRQIFIGFENLKAKAGVQRYVWDQVGLTDEKIAMRIEKEVFGC